MSENDIAVRTVVLDADTKDAVVDHLAQKYVRFYEFGLTVSGVQFIGLTYSMHETEVAIQRVSYFLLAACCLFSLFGSTVAYLVVKYIGSVRFESPEFFVHGMQTYRRWFQFCEWIPYLNSSLFLITINMLVHSQTQLAYALVFHVLSGLLTVCMVACQGIMIIRPQVYATASGAQLRRRDV